jgi:hypothetical protein
MAGLAVAADAGRSQPARSPAATAPEPNQRAQNREQELGEVLVEGDRATERRPGFKQYQQSFDWMARLVGRFVVEGSVDLHAQGRSEDLRKVSGRADCVGFGSAPGVQCELKVRWPGSTGPNGEAIPGGASHLNPAAILYGLEPAKSAISFILLDSRGIAETAVGVMVSADTMQARSKCGAIAGNCERIMRVSAAPDLKTVDMDMEFRIDEKKAVSFKFVLNRVPGAPSVVYGRKQEKEKKK